MGIETALLASAAASVFGSFYQARAQASAQRIQGLYEKQIYETNARLAELQAQDAIRRGEEEAEEYKRRVRQVIGAQRAAFGAQGVDVSFGSPLDIQEETAQLGALDALMIKNNAWREAWGYRVQALDYRRRGELSFLQAKQKSRQTLLTGGLQAAKSIRESTYLYATKDAPRYRII